MKTLGLFFSLMILSGFAFSQGNSLIGNWGIISCNYVSTEGSQQIMVDEIKSGTAITDYFFNETGSYKLTSNMSGSGTLDIYEGTWKVNDNKLIMTLTVSDRSMEIEWIFKLDNDSLVLYRENPQKTMKIVNTFKRK